MPEPRKSNTNIHNSMLKAHQQGITTVSEFKKARLLPLYEQLRKKQVDGISFLGAGSLEKYWEKHHSIPTPEKEIMSNKEILKKINDFKRGKRTTFLPQLKQPISLEQRYKETDTIVKRAIKEGVLSSTDFIKHPNFDIRTVYQRIRNQEATPKNNLKSRFFRGYGSWPDYLEGEHKLSLFTDLRYRARQPLTDREKKFINKYRKDARRIVHKYMTETLGKKIRYPLFKELIEESLVIASRYYNPKKAKISTYIIKIYEGRYATYLSKLSKEKKGKKELKDKRKKIVEPKEKSFISEEEFDRFVRTIEKLFLSKQLSRQETIVLLASLSGNSYQDIQDKLDISSTTVNNLKKKATRKLQKSIKLASGF